MAGRRSAQLAIGFSPLFLRQTTWDTPLGPSDLTHAFPATSRNWIDVDETVEEIYDCTGENLLIELVTGQVARLIIDFDVDAHLLTGWTAMNFGVAASPSGGTNEVQTQTDNGLSTGGTFQYEFIHNLIRKLSAPVAWNANAAARTSALEAMSNIGVGNVLVTGAGPFVITFQGALANTDVATLGIVSALTPSAGGTAIVETTPGVGRTHNISRLALYQGPFTTLYVGFRGSNRQPVIFKNVVADVLRVRASSRQRATATVQLVGSADLQTASAYTMPACMNINPLRYGDCSLLINDQELYSPSSVWALDNNGVPVARSWEFFNDNGILADEHAFTGQGIDITRLERADRRPSGFNISALGEKGDLLYTMATARSPRTIADISLRAGTPNRYVRYNATQTILKADSPAIQFDGTANESNIRLVGRPIDGAAPPTVVAATEQTTAYLNAA